MYQSVKTGRTLYTENKVRNLHKNIASFDWAKADAQKTIANANFLLEYGTERLLLFLAPQEIARSGVDVNQDYGCPHCGREVTKYGNHAMKIDFVKAPWKIICPNCGRQYPSNDFGKFYESGLDEHGLFSYERADRRLLVNELYPEMGEGFAVDDGQGWLKDPSDPEHCRYAFIPYYLSHCVWNSGLDMLDKSRSFSERAGLKAMHVLSEAYLITGEKKYGYAGAALYYRMALLYPTMDVSAYAWKDGYKHSHGGTGLGRMAGCITDAHLMLLAVSWYDMLFPCIDDDFAAYLCADPARYIGETPQTGAQIRNLIEEKMLMQIYPDIRTYVLDCNPGPHHALLLKTAKILERNDLFDEYADYLFQYVDHTRRNRLRYDLETMFITEIDRDGFAGEVSLLYNSVWLQGFAELASLLQGHKYDLFRHPKFCKFGSIAAKYVMADHYTLHAADFEKCGNPGLYVLQNTQVQFFLATRQPQDAQLLVKVCGEKPICTDWYQDCAAVDKLIRDTAAKAGVFHSESRCLPGFGFAAVESHPEGKDPESLGVYFGRNFGHAHWDMLNLTLYGFGIELMPDHGYPNYADSNPHRYRWTSNAISHNTVTILQDKLFPKDRLLQPNLYDTVTQERLGGKIRHYFTDGKASLIEAEAENCFNREYISFVQDVFRRTVIAVDSDGKSRYIIDLFACGAEKQYISYHAVGTKTDVTDTVFAPQNGGTYAGEDVPYEDYNHSRLWGDGFHYLTDVRRSHCPGPFTVDWKCEDNWHVWEKERDVHVKIHMLSDVSEAALCTGQPPQARLGNPKEMTYLIAACEEGPTEFVSVLEPYEDACFIERAELLRKDETAAIIRVSHKNGRVDYIVVNRGKETVTINGVTVSGFFNVLCFASDGSLSYGTAYGTQVLTGTVCGFEKELKTENFVTVQFDDPAIPDCLVGKYIDIATNEEPNAFFAITNAESLGDGKWNLGIGDCSPITGFADRDHKEKGYTYVFSEGAVCTITL